MKTIPLKKELTEKQKVNVVNLIAALKSGKYSKTCGQLLSTSEEGCCFCSAGVALEILNIPHNERGRGFDCSGMLSWNDFIDEEYGFKPISCQILLNKNLAYDLTSCNDDLNFSFNGIGDLLQIVLIDREEKKISIDESGGLVIV